jgi:hypothetical protein
MNKFGLPMVCSDCIHFVWNFIEDGEGEEYNCHYCELNPDTCIDCANKICDKFQEIVYQ